MITRHQFARDILTLAKLPPHVNNYVALVAWMDAEGSVARFNPLATTRPEPGATDFNTTHVKHYCDRAQGVKATVDTLNNGNYETILHSLRREAVATTTLSMIISSPWGTHVPNAGTFIEAIRADWTRYAFAPVAS